jgi:hypothetical protein
MALPAHATITPLPHSITACSVTSPASVKVVSGGAAPSWTLNVSGNPDADGKLRAAAIYFLNGERDFAEGDWYFDVGSQSITPWVYAWDEELVGTTLRIELRAAGTDGVSNGFPVGEGDSPPLCSFEAVYAAATSITACTFDGEPNLTLPYADGGTVDLAFTSEEGVTYLKAYVGNTVVDSDLFFGISETRELNSWGDLVTLVEYWAASGDPDVGGAPVGDDPLCSLTIQRGGGVNYGHSGKIAEPKDRDRKSFSDDPSGPKEKKNEPGRNR